MLRLKPYAWKGAYAEMRSAHASKPRQPRGQATGYHDTGLCAELRAPWMEEHDRLIIRSSEIVAYETGYLYDDHIPPCEKEGRGRDYNHIPFKWDVHDESLHAAHCNVPGIGRFSLELKAGEDHVDVGMDVQNGMSRRMGNVDWHFCVIGYESPSIGDGALTRTFLYDGKRLRSLSELSFGLETEMFLVRGGNGFVPSIHASYPRNPVMAAKSLVLVESADGRHCAGVGFGQAHTIFSNTRNRCFHADPYFASIELKGEIATARGRIYLVEGTSEELLKRYTSEFG